MSALAKRTEDEDAQWATDEKRRRLVRLTREAGVNAPAKGWSCEDWYLLHAAVISEAAGINPATGEPFYSVEEVQSWHTWADEQGADRFTLNSQVIAGLVNITTVPNARFRQRYLELVANVEEYGASTLATALDWTRIDGDGERKPDGDRVREILGIKTKSNGRYVRVRVFIDYDVAVQLADALDIEYTAVGI